MPNVIDSFVLEIGLDPSKFTRGERDMVDSLRDFEETARRSGQEIEAQSKTTGEILYGLKREFLGFVGLAIGGAEARRFIDYITELDASNSRLALTIGMSTRELSAWQGAAQQTGGSAQSMTSSLQGLSGEMNRFLLTGQSTILPVLSRLGIGLFDTNHQLKTAAELLLELSDAVKGMTAPQAAAFLNMIPGMNQDTINLLIQGRKAVEGYLAAARQAGTTTEESAAAAKEFQKDLAQLEQTATSLGRSIFTALAPGLTWVLERLTQLGQVWQAIGGFLGTAPGGHGPAPSIPSDRDRGIDLLRQAYQTGARPIPNEVEGYIRTAAASRGIDPDVAVAVAKSEGLYGYVGDRGTSFGPYQLHYGGLQPGQMGAVGLGDRFTRETGLDARDPATWKAQINFALDQARIGGWGPWHGWHGAAFAGIGSGGGSSTVNIDAINVNAPHATDAEGVAREIGPALKRSLTAGAANTGPQ